MAELIAIAKEERERIRDALQRYKDMHGISDKEISERMKLRIGLSVPGRTLQRFLHGKHRTDDASVHRCRKFLAMVAPPPIEDEVAMALAKFLPVSAAASRNVQALAGSYSSFERGYEREAQPKTGSLNRLLASRSQVAALRRAMIGFRPGFSNFMLESVEGKPGFLRIDQTYDGLPPGSVDSFVRQGPSVFGSSGILLPCSAGEYLGIVRSFVDAHIYLLRRISIMPMALRGLVFRSGSPDALLSSIPQLPGWHPESEIILVHTAQFAALDKVRPKPVTNV